MNQLNPILTKEERDVLIWAAVHPNLQHLDISEIGQQLGMSVTTVKTHIHQACIKLGADNRNEAVFIAMKRGEIFLDELLPLEELADILCSMEPDELRWMADFVRQNPEMTDLPETDRQIRCIDGRHPRRLTNRERDVLMLSSRGLTNQEIADKLCMTTSAVRTFLNRAFNKLGARKKADAVQLALKHKEISVGEISSLNELTTYMAPLGADKIEELAEILRNKQEQESILV